MTSKSSRPSGSDLLHSPISVRFGQEVLDWGIATIPKAVLRFYRYLESDGERLSDREMMALVLILTLGADRDFQLRLGNLPSATPLKTLQYDYLRKWRRMGIVQTTRCYYTAEEMLTVFGADNMPLTPRLKNVVFDLSGLLYNIFLVAREWTRRHHAAIVAWEASGNGGPQPVFEFPDTFRHEIVLPPDQAALIRKGAYQFVPQKWISRAHDVPDENRQVRADVPDENRQVRADVPDENRQVRADAPDENRQVRTDAPDENRQVRTDVPDKNRQVRADVPDENRQVQARTRRKSSGHLESSVLTNSNVSNVSNVFPANAGAKSAHPVSPPAVKNKNSLSASSVTGLPEEHPAGRDVKGPARPAEQQPQGREVPDLPQEHSAHHTTADQGRQQGVASEADAAWKSLSSTEGLTVPEKVRYWEVAVARAKHNPGGCLCRAVNDLLGLKPNYGHAGKLAKQYGRMEVWRQVKKALLDPPKGDFWAYIARALENGNTPSVSRNHSASAWEDLWNEQVSRPDPEASVDQEDTPPDPAATVWTDVLDQLQFRLPPAVFRNHLQHTTALGLHENDNGRQLLVQVRNRMTEEILSHRLDRQIQRAVETVVDYPLQVVFCCDGEEVT